MDPTTGFVSGQVRVWLRLEGLAALVAATLLYARSEYSWVLFAALFLTPDVSLAAYAAGPRIGGFVYNALHSYFGPAVLAIGLLVTDRPLAVPLVWIAHIGFDRALGLGLKYESGFRDTHLGQIGRRS